MKTPQPTPRALAFERLNLAQLNRRLALLDRHTHSVSGLHKKAGDLIADARAIRTYAYQGLPGGHK